MMHHHPPSYPPFHHHYDHVHHYHWAPSPSPSPSSSSLNSNPMQLPFQLQSPPSTSSSSTNSNSNSPVDFSPPLIAMVVIIATAFLCVTYSRLIARHLSPPLTNFFNRFRHHRHHRRSPSFLPSSSSFDSLPFDSSFDNNGPHPFSPYGLDDSIIKTIPFSLYTFTTPHADADADDDDSSRRDCAVCLFEFQHDDYVRTLPICSHTFHVDCIDAWLRSHANCPLCRAGVLCAESPPFFTPMMAARIRPSLDDETILHRISMDPLMECPSPVPPFNSAVPEITPCVDDSQRIHSEDRFGGRDFMLKRSYSFGFERSLASERMLVMEPATASPWRHRRGSSSFWSKRPSPFGSLGKSRVFSFRYYRGMKSPFFRRRGFLPLSESSMRYGGGGGSSSSRRTKSMVSPMFLRSAGVAAFSSSRLRCGDPEALLSPERFNRR